MNELQTLIKQKKEIEARIRELKDTEIVCGNAKLGHIRYPTGLEHWYIAINVAFPNVTRWHKVSVSDISRADAIGNLDSIITDLTALKAEIERSADE